MKRTRALNRTLFAIGLLLASCTGSSEQRPVPRRTAYPRVPVYEAAYVAAEDVPISVEVNAKACTHATTRGGAVWLNIDYPLYSASVYCTLTPVTPQTLMSVVDNRAERMRLNVGDAPITIKQFNSESGYQVTIAESPTAKATPLQFLAANEKWVLSGAAFFHNADRITSLDSVAPMVEVLERDITYSLENLKP